MQTGQAEIEQSSKTLGWEGQYIGDRRRRSRRTAEQGVDHKDSTNALCKGSQPPCKHEAAAHNTSRWHRRCPALHSPVEGRRAAGHICSEPAGGSLDAAIIQQSLVKRPQVAPHAHASPAVAAVLQRPCVVGLPADKQGLSSLAARCAVQQRQHRTPQLQASRGAAGFGWVQVRAVAVWLPTVLQQAGSAGRRLSTMALTSMQEPLA